MDKINLDDQSRYVKRLHSRVMRKRRIQVVLFAAVIAVVLVWVSITVFNTLKNFRFPKLKFGQTKKIVKKTENENLTFVLIGVDQRDYEQYASGASLVSYNKEEKTINSLAFKKTVRLQIPGYGLDVIEKSLFAGTESALAAVTNVTGVQVDKYLMVDSDDYGTSKSKLKKSFKTILESNFKEKERTALSKEFDEINKSDINILEAPTKLISLGSDQPYEQLKKNDVKRLVEMVTEKKVKKRKKAIVLNGSGVGGLAGKLGIKLIKAGYEVIDIKNANSFNYKQTKVVVYSQDMQKKALEIRKLVGVGTTMLELDKQGLTDVTVIIGKDYKK